MDKEKVIREFIEFATKRLNLNETPDIQLISGKEFAQERGSLGVYNTQTKTIEVATEGRLTADILRTIAHEMVHRRQDELGIKNDDPVNNSPASSLEMKANAVAGILLREYGKQNRQIFLEHVWNGINIPLHTIISIPMLGVFKSQVVEDSDQSTFPKNPKGSGIEPKTGQKEPTDWGFEDDPSPPRIKNPETGKGISATSALKKDHPAYNAAKVALKKEDGAPTGGVGLVLPGGYINGAPKPKDVKKMKKKLTYEKKAPTVKKEDYDRSMTDKVSKDSSEAEEIRHHAADRAEQRKRLSDEAEKKKEEIKQWREDQKRKREALKTDEVQSMKLGDILKESKYSHINLIKIEALLEKLIPTLPKEGRAEVKRMFTELQESSAMINEQPYGIFNCDAVQFELFGVSARIGALREFLVKEQSPRKKNSVLMRQTIKALDEIFGY